MLVSHSMEDIAKVANRVIVINDAKLFTYGSVDEVFSRSRELAEMGLSIPQVSKIMLRLQSMGFDVSEHIYTVDAAKCEILRLLGKGNGANA